MSRGSYESQIWFEEKAQNLSFAYSFFTWTWILRRLSVSAYARTLISVELSPWITTAVTVAEFAEGSFMPEEGVISYGNSITVMGVKVDNRRCVYHGKMLYKQKHLADRVAEIASTNLKPAHAYKCPELEEWHVGEPKAKNNKTKYDSRSIEFFAQYLWLVAVKCIWLVYRNKHDRVMVKYRRTQHGYWSTITFYTKVK